MRMPADARRRRKDLSWVSMLIFLYVGKEARRLDVVRVQRESSPKQPRRLEELAPARVHDGQEIERACIVAIRFQQRFGDLLRSAEVARREATASSQRLRLGRRHVSQDTIRL